MRKVYVDVKVRLIINMNEDVSVDHIISDMDYDFSFSGEEADIIDTEITDFNVIDSK
jgi:hypothetical protein